MKVNILGEEWNIKEIEEKEDCRLEGTAGICDNTVRELILNKEEFIVDKDSCKDLEVYKRITLRHELIHAFLDESGLKQSSDWARNEEMVDWFANQFPKLLKAFKECDVLG